MRSLFALCVLVFCPVLLHADNPTERLGGDIKPWLDCIVGKADYRITGKATPQIDGKAQAIEFRVKRFSPDGL